MRRLIASSACSRLLKGHTGLRFLQCTDVLIVDAAEDAIYDAPLTESVRLEKEAENVGIGLYESETGAPRVSGMGKDKIDAGDDASGVCDRSKNEMRCETCP